MGNKSKKNKKDKDRKAAKAQQTHAPERAVQADDEIARAEQRLAAALRQIDEARDALTARERELMALLERYGRLPTSQDAPAATSQDGAESSSIDGVAAVSTDETLLQETGTPAAQTTSPSANEH